MLPLLATAVGIYLGLHFNVLVLAPFCALGAGAYVAASLWDRLGILASAADLIVPLVAIQMGYFLGLVSRGSLKMVLTRFNLRPSKRV